LAFIFLLIALIAILRGNVRVHKGFIYAALVSTVLFLVNYVVFHFIASSTSFGGEGFIVYVYYFILVIYIILSFACVSFVCFIVVALVSTFLFLLNYVVFHFIASSTSFGVEGFIVYVYYFILVTHIILAMATIPLVLTSVTRAWNEENERHKKIARWTMPIW